MKYLLGVLENCVNHVQSAQVNRCIPLHLIEKPIAGFKSNFCSLFRITERTGSGLIACHGTMS